MRTISHFYTAVQVFSGRPSHTKPLYVQKEITFLTFCNLFRVNLVKTIIPVPSSPLSTSMAMLCIAKWITFYLNFYYWFDSNCFQVTFDFGLHITRLHLFSHVDLLKVFSFNFFPDSDINRSNTHVNTTFFNTVPIQTPVTWTLSFSSVTLRIHMPPCFQTKNA